MEAPRNATLTTIAPVEFATVLPGAEPFKEGNVTDTFRGQVLRADGSVADVVLKDIPQKELANELLSFVLARGLSLPIPDALLAQAHEDDLPTGKGPLTLDGRRLVLASVDVKAPSVMFRYLTDEPGRVRLLSAIAAWPPLGRLYGFDAWVANVDRNTGNLLFGGGAEAWLIDHGWAFTGPEWTTPTLEPRISYRHRLREWLTPHLNGNYRTTLANRAGMLEADLKSLNIDASILASHASLLLAREELEAVRRFLKLRVCEVTRLASLALDAPVMI